MLSSKYMFFGWVDTVLCLSDKWRVCEMAGTTFQGLVTYVKDVD